ncbi:hypothetical protein [Longispora fulva]|uniref:Uncharacterized protein n=1 Tax=Longispora fulva TaxID=619741 RepID=A0A8J7KDX0_9ACTN|nr:hypothetical protein [Longispora fulva]MBG6134520.1 hypothetical protein [Longispora fulva]
MTHPTTPAPLGPEDVHAAAATLRKIIAAVESGALDAHPLMLARLTGALDVLDVLDTGRADGAAR